MIFYSLDDLYYIDLNYEQKDEGLEVSCGSDHLILDESQIALSKDQDADQQDQAAGYYLGGFHFFLCHEG